MATYPSRQQDGPYELIVFDLRAPRTRRRLISERVAWRMQRARELGYVVLVG